MIRRGPARQAFISALLAILGMATVFAQVPLPVYEQESGPFNGALPIGQFLAPSTADCTLPSYSFTSDPNTGVTNTTADTLSFCTGGALVARFPADPAAGPDFFKFYGSASFNLTGLWDSGVLIGVDNGFASGNVQVDAIPKAATGNAGFYTYSEIYGAVWMGQFTGGSTAAGTTFGLSQANSHFLTGSGGILAVGTDTSHALSFATNNVVRMSVAAASPTFSFGSTTAATTFSFDFTPTGGVDTPYTRDFQSDFSSSDFVDRVRDNVGTSAVVLYSLDGGGSGVFNGNVTAGAAAAGSGRILSTGLAITSRLQITSSGDGSMAVSNNAATAQSNHINGSTKTLVDNSATTFARVAIAADTSAVVCLMYQVDAENATDQQTIGGFACIPIINDNGAETCGTIVEAGESNHVSVGTITSTITCTGAGTSTIDLALASNTSLDVSPLLKWQAFMGSSAGVTISAQ